mmetsp:Transcript_69526/g.145209  ORF Transcript_69526/g.145209 Transcript_69526/m.145209 type:complete len:123 (-) Transcript_69526:20-388(-)
MVLSTAVPAFARRSADAGASKRSESTCIEKVSSSAQHFHTNYEATLLEALRSATTHSSNDANWDKVPKLLGGNKYNERADKFTQKERLRSHANCTRSTELSLAYVNNLASCNEICQSQPLEQ